jgi:superfamily II DNA or RNA helicase
MDDINCGSLLEQSFELEQPRFTDVDLLELRRSTFADEVLAELIESDSYQQMSPWQQETTRRLQVNTRAEQTIDLPTRTGKSYLLREFVKGATEHGMKSLILAPRKHILVEHASELADAGIKSNPLDFSGETETDALVQVTSIQSVAMNRMADPTVTEDIDIVAIDEVHRALGERTLEGIRSLFPNAVFVTFSATTEYADNRSVTDEYGDKIISHNIVEAISKGTVPPVRAMLYVTGGEIKTLDPNFKDFTPRELEKLAHMSARNNTIVEFATDLVTDGRQGLITTIPGEDLLHADILKERLEKQTIVQPDGTTRNIRAEVVRGSQSDLQAVLDEYNQDGTIDILLSCDVLREGAKLTNASFLINGRPTTSIVNLTQDIGRIFEPKDGEMIVIDFKDKSVKAQKTIFDVLELDRSTQGVRVGPTNEGLGGEGLGRDSFLRGLFRPGLVDALKQFDNILLAEFEYKPEELSRYERLRLRRLEEAEKEEAKQTKIWEKILARENLAAEQPDTFMTEPSMRSVVKDDSDLILDIVDQWHSLSYGQLNRSWSGFDGAVGIVPVVPINPKQLVKEINSTNPANDDFDPQNNMVVERNLVQRPQILEVFKQLTQRERNVIVARFGLDYQEPRTLNAIGQELDVTRERVRQIEIKAIGKMGRPENFDDGAPRNSETFNPSHELILQDYLPVVDEPTPEPEVKAELAHEEKEQRIKQNQEVVKMLQTQFRHVNWLFKGSSYHRSDGDTTHYGMLLIDRLMVKLGLDPREIGCRGSLLDVLVRDGIIETARWDSLLTYQKTQRSTSYPDGRPYLNAKDLWTDADRRINHTLDEVAQKYRAKYLNSAQSS